MFLTILRMTENGYFLFILYNNLNIRNAFSFQSTTGSPGVTSLIHTLYANLLLYVSSSHRHRHRHHHHHHRSRCSCRRRR